VTSKDGADGDDDLDAMMGSMRSMWRELPDEEPPSNGFDALMAAARVQAAKMAPPEKDSWVRRALAMLVRPPMLAAATAVLLVGTTVMLTRRDGGEGISVPVAETRTRPAAGADEIAPKREGKATDLDKTDDDNKPATKKDAFGQGSAAVAPGNTAPVQRPRPPVVKPADPIKETPTMPPPAIEPPKPDPPPVVIDTGKVKGFEDSEEKVPVGNTKHGETDRPTSIKVEGARPQVEPTSPDTVVTGGRQPPSQVSATQLLQQAETAAKRNDCPAVRATADRIRKLDDKLYKSRVVTQPAIKRCL